MYAYICFRVWVYMCVCTCMGYILGIFSKFKYVLYIVYVHLNQNFRVRKEKKILKNKENFYYFEPFFINKRSFRSPWGKRIMKVNGKYYRLKRKKNFFFKIRE